MKTATVPSWCFDALGLPFELGSNGPDTFDCWGIVRWGMWHGWEVGLPRLDGLRDGVAIEQVESALEVSGGVWTRVDAREARPGDVLQFVGQGQSLHVGLVVSPGLMLHAVRGATVQLGRYKRSPWAGRLVAGFRHEEVRP